MKKNISFFILLLIISLIVCCQTYAQSTRKAPYLIYTGDNTEMQVLWQLVSTEICTLEWGTDLSYSIGNVQTSQYGSDHQHTYTIPNLTPDTKYFYRVTVNSEIHYGSFYSAPDDNATSLKFFAYGDTRSYPADHDLVAEKMVETYTADEEFQTIVISMGDLISNGDSEDDWDNEFFDPTFPGIQEMLSTLPYESCIGNHEGTGVLFSKYFPYLFEAGRYWSFDYGPVHFVVVDQYTNYDPGSAQLDWIASDLASTSKIWKFIYLHEPGWSAGGHSNNTSVQNYIQPLCEQYGVSILFAGHNHYYARAEVNNIIHITTGGGGAPLYPPNISYPNIVTASQDYHFCTVEINNNLLNFTAVKPDGSTIDAFTIENPLPVELSYFSANVSGNTVNLNWRTETEVNNYGFEILRTAQDETWDVLGFVEGYGNSNSPKEYSFVDDLTLTYNLTPNITPVLRYRLKQIDNDGKFEYSKIIKVRVNIPLKFELSQNYPNPFNPNTIISFSIPHSGSVNLSVYNLTGERVVELVNAFKEAGRYTVNFDASGLSSGIYLYKLSSEKASLFKKLVLTK